MVKHTGAGFLSVLIFLSAISVSAQEIIKLGRIDDKVSSDFISAIVDKKSFDLPSEKQLYPLDKQLYDVWRGNVPEMSPVVEELIINFAIPGQDSSATDNPPFSLLLDLKNENIVLRHSQAMFKLQQGGFRLYNLNRNKFKSFFYRGRNGSGVVLHVPQIAKTDTPKGVLVCPRDFKKIENPLRSSDKDRRDLQYNGYKIDSVKAVVNATVRARLENLLNFVMAKVGIVTTAGLPRSVTESDQIYSRRAEAETTYSPDLNEQVPPIEDKDNFSIGIGTYAEQQFSTGFKRYAFKSNVVYVKRVDISSDISTPMNVADTKGTLLYSELENRQFNMGSHGVIDVNALAGPCYLVLNEVRPIIYEYQKAPFELPEKYRLSAESRNEG